MNRLQFTAQAASTRLKAALWPPFRRKRALLREHLRALFARRRIDAVLDVGANRGQYARFLRYEVGYAGRIWSFEPNPDLQPALRARAAHDGRWTVLPYALSSASGTLRLNIMARSELSSVLAPDASHTAVCADSNVVTRTAEVPARTLDSLLDGELRSLDAASTYLKLDTQGHDLEVLAGASRLLAACPALQTELSFVPLYAGMPEWRGAVDFLQRHGLELNGLFPVTRDAQLRLIEADGVFVRPA